MQFTYVDTYPDEAPVIEVPSHEGMDDSDVENLREFLEQEVILFCMYLYILGTILHYYHSVYFILGEGVLDTMYMDI